MKRTILPVLVLSLFGFTAAGAFPALQKPQSNSSDLIEVGHKGKGHGGKHQIDITTSKLSNMAENTITATAIGRIATVSPHRLARVWLHRCRSRLVLPLTSMR